MSISFWISIGQVAFHAMMNSLILHQHRLSCFYDELLFNQDVGDWMKAKSTTWYSYFLVSQYNDSRWTEHFESNNFFLKLKHLMEKKDTKYKCVVPIGIHIIYSFYKFAYCIAYHHWSKIFAIKKLTIHLVLQEFINVVNVDFRHHIKWPKGRLFGRSNGVQSIFWFAMYPWHDWCHSNPFVNTKRFFCDKILNSFKFKS